MNDSGSTAATRSEMSASIDHYENFPVASWLCPPRLRPPIAAIYQFARTADDLADEGDATAQQRLADLTIYGADLTSITDGQPPSPRWRHVFEPLAAALRTYELPIEPLTNLLSAFEQDVRFTRNSTHYADRAELLDYCSRSAAPVGRLLLHLYDVHDPTSLRLSDDVCSALQLINFWQDLSIDIRRGRHYLPLADCARFGVTQADLHAPQQTDNVSKLIAEEAGWARALMLNGSKIVHQVPGRGGWELRAVVQGGLTILDKIAAMNFQTLKSRPTVGRRDAPMIVWHSLWM
ncbi:MAG: squalene synthase HpnC [Burkholderiaceae bacterium]